MKTFVVLTLSAVISADGFVVVQQDHSRRSVMQSLRSRPTQHRLAFRPDTTESPTLEDVSLPSVLSVSSFKGVKERYAIGPWHDSVADDQELVFAEFWNWHLDFVKSNLTNVRSMPAMSRDGAIDFSLLDKKDARMVNLCFQTDEYRKVRMSHYDGGNKIQVLQALWYPDPKYNLPILGIEMAQFGGGARHMMASDFQPIHDDEADHATMFRHRIDPIRAEFPSLQGEMSGRYYDYTHFTESMLFSRFQDENMIETDVVPAIQEYTRAHLKMLREVEPDESSTAMVMERQTAFDKYFAERDQAIHMFRAKMGNEWAEGFVYDFLFELSR